MDQWDEKSGTVHPDDVLNSAVEAYEEYPNKRLIIHFMQPHYPYFGPTAERLEEEINFSGWKKERGSDNQSNSSHEDISWIEAVRQGEITRSDLRQVYRETLDFVLKYVADVANETDGKTVVTADHGEMLGERLWPYSRRRYGHRRALATPELRIVPWFEMDTDTRRSIVSDDPIGSDDIEEEVIENRLKSLGYVD